jgi:hypothetical protein
METFKEVLAVLEWIWVGVVIVVLVIALSGCNAEDSKYQIK